MTANARIEDFLAKYTPQIAADLRAARRALSAHLPRGYELVYDNYNALVFAFAPTERTSDALISVAGYPRWVTLFFMNGASLLDPEGLLDGEGTTVRSVRLTPASLIDSAPVVALIKAALADRAKEFAKAPKLTTIVKSVAAKQRSRRPAR
jgi:hypothetical protein